MPRSIARYNIVLCGVVAVFALIIAVNVLVDPFERDGLSPLELPREYNAYLTLRSEQRLWLMLKYRRQRSPVVVIGDSRTARLAHPDARHLKAAGIKNAFNFSFGGAGLREIVDAARYVSEQNASLATILMLASFEQSTAGPLDSRFGKLMPIALNPFKYYSSLYVFDFSVRDLLMADMKSRPGAYVRRVEIYENIKAVLARLWPSRIAVALEHMLVPTLWAQRWRHPPTPEGTWEGQLRIAERTARAFRYDPDKPRMLADEAAALRRRGIRLVFVMPPTHPDVLSVYSRFGMDAPKRTYLATLARAAPVLELSAPTTDRTNFDDPTHPLDPVNRPVARAVAAFVLQSQQPAAARNSTPATVLCPRHPAEAETTTWVDGIAVLSGQNCRTWTSRGDLAGSVLPPGR